MSIIVGIISRKCGVAASDGRIFKSVALDSSGNPTAPPDIECEAFDKTFMLQDPPIIGAFAGLMRFSGKTPAQHISALSLAAANTLEDASKLVESGLISLLQQIANTGVRFQERKLDVLLVGQETLNAGGFQIAALRFHPDSSNTAILCDRHIIPTPPQAGTHKVYGDGAAGKAASEVLKAKHAPNVDLNFLRRLGDKAIQAGIRAAGGHPYNTAEKSCGGTIFRRALP